MFKALDANEPGSGWYTFFEHLGGFTGGNFKGIVSEDADTMLSLIDPDAILNLIRLSNLLPERELSEEELQIIKDAIPENELTAILLELLNTSPTMQEAFAKWK